MVSKAFEFVEAINSKRDITKESDTKINEYNAWLINRALSYHLDTLTYALTMNINHTIPNIAQFHYMLNTVRPRKRFSKWPKPPKDEVLEMIARQYECNIEVAKQYRMVLNDTDIELLKSIDDEERGISR